MSEIHALVDEVNRFRDERDWRQFHNAKDLALSISIEAAELLEVFQWKSAAEAQDSSRDHLAEELADVLIYCLMLADDLGMSVEEIVRAKLQQNALKYPVDAAKGSRRKYTDLPGAERG